MKIQVLIKKPNEKSVITSIKYNADSIKSIIKFKDVYATNVDNFNYFDFDQNVYMLIADYPNCLTCKDLASNKARRSGFNFKWAMLYYNVIAISCIGIFKLL